MRKGIGIGSFSILLLICGVIWATDFDKFCLGDLILEFIGLAAWSNGSTGFHYTIGYSLLFFVPAVIIGYKYPNDLFSKLGKNISLFLGAFSLLCVVFAPFTA